MLTGFQDESLGDQALKEGAQDYLVKGQVDSKLLARSMRYAIARKAVAECTDWARGRSRQSRGAATLATAADRSASGRAPRHRPQLHVVQEGCLIVKGHGERS